VINQQNPFLCEMKAHHILFGSVSNEDIALTIDCTQMLSHEKFVELKGCLFAAHHNDNCFFSHLKYKHMSKVVDQMERFKALATAN
jgi:hypothetical protein